MPEPSPSTRFLQAEAHAKINAGLHVLRRRPDGFHDLDTVFLRIGWADTLTLRPAPTLVLTCSDPTLPTDEGNLCMRAAQRFTEHFGVTGGVAIHLEKRLPYGAGLGGGSSDAAATLNLLAKWHGVEAKAHELHTLAAALGSDVPFFLGTDAARGTGRGTDLTPLVHPEGSAYRLPHALVVAVPDVHSSTAEAYAGITPNAVGRANLAEVVTSNDLGRWRRELVNDFEPALIAQYPAIGAVKHALLRAGAGYAAMSGSGSAVFGVFTSPAAAAAAANALRQPGIQVWTDAPEAAPA
ncbi:MAG: 4-(cytidine 5'-diphospho)-2-C-methyl-D-erythritol kinase [Bacteroidota bacterium]